MVVGRTALKEENADRVFRALADPTRRDVLRRAMQGTLSVSGLARLYPMSTTAVQKHVAVLEDAGLVHLTRHGQQLHGWWRVISVVLPRSLEFEEGCGPPNEHLPATTAEVRLVGTTETTTMTIITRFASVADMEQLLGIGKGEGTRQAVGQIDAILAITTAS